MRKIAILLSLIATICWIGVVPAMAQENVQEEITTSDLGIENPGILPTSPFYFLKEWKRDLKKVFTFNPVKKAELELEEANERAAEIKKLEEINPQNTGAITKAVQNYQRNMERLKTRLENLKETSENPNVDNLLDKLVDRSFKHQQLFDNLQSKFEEKIELKEQLRAGQEKIDEVVSQIPKKFEEPAAFSERLENMIQNQAEGVFRNIRAVEIIDRVVRKLPAEQQEKFQGLKEKLEGEIVSPTIEPRACTLEAKICPDGSAVARVGPNCEFTPCPDEDSKTDNKDKEKDRACIQIITPAQNPQTGECKEFPTPCDVPLNWQNVNNCAPVTNSPSIQQNQNQNQNNPQ